MASARLAQEVGVDVFLIATDVPGAIINFGGPGESLLREVSTADAGQYLKQGHFPAGSMGPKVEAALQFCRHSDKKAVICSIEEIDAAVSGTAGTQILPSSSKRGKGGRAAHFQ
jgi:carbamate kinase